MVATVAAGPGGQPYNVNADAAAGSLAAALGAEKLVYLTDVEGLYADLADSGSLLEQLTVARSRPSWPRGVVAAGMVPKLTGIVTALRGGVRRPTSSTAGASTPCCWSCSPIPAPGPMAPRRRRTSEQPARA